MIVVKLVFLVTMIIAGVVIVVVGGVQVVEKQGWPGGDDGRKGGNYDHGDASIGGHHGRGDDAHGNEGCGDDGYGKVVVPTWW
ncbi:hypothetical protein DVH24_020374 [Malus domestica]|uniref:Uncharacterized protein n=1 Tax=Malus domestica TaxID=3750 RepID=A0A498JD85_MALDO|nr:hypothetical protein DVH24_020374 [Malus domestica]